jgi:murein DD-endopeptidase MepM/ murein hydrolase activator NlpD
MALVPTYKKKSGSPLRVLLVLVLVAAAVGGYILQRELRLPAPAQMQLTASQPAIGRKTVVTLRAREPVRGLVDVKLTADGAGVSAKTEATFSGDDSGSAADDKSRQEVVLHLDLGKEPTPQIKPGSVTVRASAQARGTRLRQPAPVTANMTLPVRLDPPALAASSQLVHPAQGGAEVVVYDVGATANKHGVRVGDWFFPGYPLPGAPPSQRFAMFAAPYDLEADEAEARRKILLIAEDELGNQASTEFIHKYVRRPLRKDVIELKDSFMQKVVGEIYPRTPALTRTGNLLEDYLQLNRHLRQQNMTELRALAAKSEPRFLWRQGFLPMQNAAVKGSFADRRSYLFEGKQVDAQDHLGFDLASLKGAPVQSANDGRVVLARYFGVFGNCVVVDHGYGLQSLYAHLSTMSVKSGDQVKRGQELGRTGATGLAGGDHLHFTMVLHGLPVTPVEWWDDHWIQDRLKLKLGPALPWTATGK